MSKIFLYFESDVKSNIPSTPAEIISPAPTVTIRYGNASVELYAYISTNGTITVFESMGGTVAKDRKSVV